MISGIVCLVAWVMALSLTWGVVIDKIQPSALAWGAWIFFILIGLGAGLVSKSDTLRK